ncbi:signal recognition particle protein [Candidatus Providencia siddallii]|uniref:Signal recognition particle protein n=1 Tax=Candidatus Providencia siddallii TaxID=1715285 RepID=A0ABM9NPS3_9GAMM
MFNNLTKKLSFILNKISTHGRITEDNIKNTLREIQITLLEADVSLQVVRDFIKKIKKNAIGQNINKSLTPGQEFIKLVKYELIKIMGEKNNELQLSHKPPIPILIIGLPGAGKTITTAKIGNFLKKQNKKILIASTDIYRPAAIEQLEKLSKIIKIDFFQSNKKENPTLITQKALKYAHVKFYDILLIDTTGVLHTNKTIISEIKKIHSILKPAETLFVMDAMTGQDTANISKTFNKTLELTGIILTKIDGDVRGGAALSITSITGKPIKFLGTGEKINDLEIFHPERIVSNMLGSKNLSILLKEIENEVKKNKNKKLNKELNDKNFNLNDFLKQLKQMQNLGGISNIINNIPNIQQLPNTFKPLLNNKMLKRMEAIINSMTYKERENPIIINGSRKRRIAFGSGASIQEINYLLKQFNNMQKIIKKIKKIGLKKMFSGIKKIMHINF